MKQNLLITENATPLRNKIHNTIVGILDSLVASLPIAIVGGFASGVMALILCR